MKCKHCGGNTGVVDSRHKPNRNVVWRRRRCKKCGRIMQTEECAVTPAYVPKKIGHNETNKSDDM